MSKVKNELSEATEMTQRRGESEEDFKLRILKAVSNLPEEGWEGLSKKSQDWYNDAADAIDAKAAIPAFPDEEVEKKEEKTSRRSSEGSKKKEEPEEKEAKPDEEEFSPKVGDNVVVITKRGKEIKGEIVEIDGDVIVLKTEDGEEETPRSRIDKISLQEEKKKSGKKDSVKEEQKIEADEGRTIVEGDELNIKTKRGKEYSGKVVEVTEELIVLKDKDGKEVEVMKSSIEPGGLKHVKYNTTTDKTTKSTSASKEKEQEVNKDRKEESKTGRKITRDDNGGISVTVRMRELILDDIKDSVDSIKKKLEKEGFQFRENTLSLVYSDVHKLLKLMQERKMMK